MLTSSWAASCCNPLDISVLTAWWFMRFLRDEDRTRACQQQQQQQQQQGRRLESQKCSRVLRPEIEIIDCGPRGAWTV